MSDKCQEILLYYRAFQIDKPHRYNQNLVWRFYGTRYCGSVQEYVRLNRYK